MPINQEYGMHTFNSHEMFILALVSISIVGAVCLGLIVLLALFACKRLSRNNLPDSPTSTTQRPPETPNQPQDNVDKLENIKKEIIIGTNIAISGLAFAFAIYAIQNLLSDKINNQWFGFVGWLLALVMLSFTEPVVRKWIVERSKHLQQPVNNVRYGFWIILILATVYLFIRLISHT